MTTPEPGPLRGEVVHLRSVTTHDAARLTEILTHPGVAQWWGNFDLDRVQQLTDGTLLPVLAPPALAP